MKILENNNSIEVKCPHCKSRLLITPDDLQYLFHFGHHSYIYIECAACTKEIEIEDQCPSSWSPFIQSLKSSCEEE